MDINKQAIDNLMSRTSDRLFDKNKEVEDADITTILRAGMAAPTGVNKQPWHFVVVRDRLLLDKLAAELPYCHSAKEASIAIVACGDRRRFLSGDDSTLWVQDLSAASENILLAVHALGLGAVWTSVYPHQDRMDEVSSILSLSEDLIPFNVIPVGYISRSHKPLDKWRPEYVTYM